MSARKLALVYTVSSLFLLLSVLAVAVILEPSTSAAVVNSSSHFPLASHQAQRQPADFAIRAGVPFPSTMSVPMSNLTRAPIVSPTSTSVTLPYCWTSVPAPDQGQNWTQGSIQGISALSSSDIWTLVSYADSNGIGHTSAAHWNGKNWGLFEISTLPQDASLTDLVAISDTDVWSVGLVALGPYTSHTLTVHWNGSQWRVVPSPNGSPYYFNRLLQVDASSSNNVWAVGDDYFESPPRAGVGPLSGASEGIVLRWNGVQWDYMDTHIPVGDGSFGALQVISPHSVWVGGYGYAYGSPPEYRAADLLYWNGTSCPSPGNGGDFAGVAALSANDVWAVGEYDGSTTLVERWDGISWQIVASPNLVGANLIFLTGIAVVASSDVWAVGGYSSDSGTYATLVEHYMGCTPTPTSTPVLTISPTSISTPTQTPTNPDCQGIPPSPYANFAGHL